MELVNDCQSVLSESCPRIINIIKESGRVEEIANESKAIASTVAALCSYISSSSSSPPELIDAGQRLESTGLKAASKFREFARSLAADYNKDKNGTDLSSSPSHSSAPMPASSVGLAEEACSELNQAVEDVFNLISSGGSTPEKAGPPDAAAVSGPSSTSSLSKGKGSRVRRHSRTKSSSNLTPAAGGKAAAAASSSSSSSSAASSASPAAIDGSSSSSSSPSHGHGHSHKRRSGSALKRVASSEQETAARRQRSATQLAASTAEENAAAKPGDFSDDEDGPDESTSSDGKKMIRFRPPRIAYSLTDYKPPNEEASLDQLELSKGDKLLLLVRHSNGWCKCRQETASGLLITGYVSVYMINPFRFYEDHKILLPSLQDVPDQKWPRKPKPVAAKSTPPSSPSKNGKNGKCIIS